ncbi:MAG: M28 family peptidase [bacterium]|nr:M28 family peptidase [bacterium]
MAIAFAKREVPVPPKDSQLALIYFDTEAQLKEADQSGIYLLHYLTNLPVFENGLTRDNRMLVLITLEQKQWLEKNQFRVQIIDEHPKPKQSYYLVQSYIPSGKELTHGLWEHRDFDLERLSPFGLANEYTYGTYLLRGEQVEIVQLKELGFELMLLDGRAELPWIIPPERKLLVPSEKQLIQSLVDQVSWSRLSSHILYLQDNDTVAGWDWLGSRYAYNTAQWFPKTYYILTTFQSYGLTAEYDYFTHGGYTNLRNIVASQPGQDTSGYYIICAHCDSYAGRTPGWNGDTDPAPGADDNASGTAAILEVARVLSSVTTRYPIRYIAFGAEEQLMIGSNAYASTAYYSGDSIFGVINLDMIGWDWQDPLKSMSIGNAASAWIVDAMVKVNTSYHIGLDTVHKIINASIWYSDHGAFWTYGYPAILAIEWLNESYRPKNPNYHKLGDYLATLKVPFLEKMTQLSLATLAELAYIFPPPTAIDPTYWQLYP